MTTTKYKCSCCGEKLYLTVIEKRLFCRNCWCYEQENEIGEK